MEAVALIAAGAVLGAIAGSFLGAIYFRWPADRSVVAGRSECEHCGKHLAARDLVPTLSFVALRGRCRACSKPIDPRHLSIELAGALVGAVALAAHPLPLAALTALLGWWLLLIALLDHEYLWLPDRLTLPLIGAGLAAAAAGFGPPLVDRLIGAVAAYVTLVAVAAAYRGLRGRDGLGGGDPKLLAAIGAWLGWEAVPFVLLCAGLVGLAGLGIMVLRGHRVTHELHLPLGTLMAITAWPLWILAASDGGTGLVHALAS